MAHELSFKNGVAEIAFLGDRNNIWHRLGQEIPPDSSLEEWAKQASMDWTIKSSPVKFNVEGDSLSFPDKQVLYRGDTLSPLSVVSTDFKIVQPTEVLEFFRDLIAVYGMHMSSAGCLFGGKRFWATADTGRATEIIQGDTVKGFLLFSTGVDGAVSSTVKFTNVRVCCCNTMRLAINEQGGREARRTHRQTFDAREVKLDLGLLDQTWDKHIQDLKKLTLVKMSDDAAAKFFKKLVSKEVVAGQPEKEASRATNKLVDDLMDRLRNGMGAEMGRGTAYNCFNAVTERYTHGTMKRNADRQFLNSIEGNDARMKDKALAALLEMA